MNIERDPRRYPDLPVRELLLILSYVVYDLAQTHDQLGYLRSEELKQKHAIWSADLSASIQSRDRTATYSAATITTQIYEQEALLSKLREERQFIERLIDAA